MWDSLSDQNPKHEARSVGPAQPDNPKQIQRTERESTKPEEALCVSCFLLWILNLFRISCFGFRISRALLILSLALSERPSQAAPPAGADAFLDDLQHRSWFYFHEQADPTTGLVRDRAGADGGPS